MLPIVSLRRQLPKIQLCLLATDRLTRSSSSRQLHHPDEPNPKPAMAVLKRNYHGNDVAKWQRLTKANSRPLGIRFKPG